MTKEELFQEISRTHPEWSEEQIWTQVSIRLAGEETISLNPKMTANDNDIVTAIFNKAADWVESNLPYIWEKVKELFYNILNNIIEWFKERGWSFLHNIFSE